MVARESCDGMAPREATAAETGGWSGQAKGKDELGAPDLPPPLWSCNPHVNHVEMSLFGDCGYRGEFHMKLGRPNGDGKFLIEPCLQFFPGDGTAPLQSPLYRRPIGMLVARL